MRPPTPLPILDLPHQGSLWSTSAVPSRNIPARTVFPALPLFAAGDHKEAPPRLLSPLRDDDPRSVVAFKVGLLGRSRKAEVRQQKLLSICDHCDDNASHEPLSMPDCYCQQVQVRARAHSLSTPQYSPPFSCPQPLLSFFAQPSRNGMQVCYFALNLICTRA